MKTILLSSQWRHITVACALLLMLSSCAVMLPVAATSNPITANAKVGRAKATNVFGIWTDGDASIKSAATNGGITKVATVDYKITNYLWFFKTIETTVTGE